MSRTRRKDPLDVARKRGDIVFPYAGLIITSPTKEELAKAHRDKKKRHKPGRKAKKYLDKGKKTKTRRELDAVIAAPDAAPLPKKLNTHEWDWN